ncbi:fimbrial protein [Zymobacter palmae]|nr:fimbrial protein [Zymobacter palmae]
MTTLLLDRRAHPRLKRAVVLTALLVGSLALPLTASAYTCRYRSTAPNGLALQVIKGNSNATIQVPVSNTAETGQTNIIDLSSYIECKNDIPQSYSDYMDLQQATTILSNNFDVKVKARSNEYSVPFSGNANILTLPRGGSGSYAPIPLQIYYYMKEIPGEKVAIKKGQTIGAIRAHHHSIPVEGDYIFTWNFVAANETIVTSGGCAINNGDAIEIDFGSVNQKQLSSTATTRSVSRYIPYKCRSNSVTMGIQLSLVADSPSFSSSLIKTSNSAIGIKTMRGGDALTPYNNAIHSTITQGMGGDNFTFSLLKQEGTTPSTGAFTGSATLIMSAD